MPASRGLQTEFVGITSRVALSTTVQTLKTSGFGTSSIRSMWPFADCTSSKITAASPVYRPHTANLHHLHHYFHRPVVHTSALGTPVRLVRAARRTTARQMRTASTVTQRRTHARVNRRTARKGSAWQQQVAQTVVRFANCRLMPMDSTVGRAIRQSALSAGASQIPSTHLKAVTKGFRLTKHFIRRYVLGQHHGFLFTYFKAFILCVALL